MLIMKPYKSERTRAGEMARPLSALLYRTWVQLLTFMHWLTVMCNSSSGSSCVTSSQISVCGTISTRMKIITEN